jgi:hypothetical protein
VVDLEVAAVEVGQRAADRGVVEGPAKPRLGLAQGVRVAGRLLDLRAQGLHQALHREAVDGGDGEPQDRAPELGVRVGRRPDERERGEEGDRHPGDPRGQLPAAAVEREPEHRQGHEHAVAGHRAALALSQRDDGGEVGERRDHGEVAR